MKQIVFLLFIAIFKESSLVHIKRNPFTTELTNSIALAVLERNSVKIQLSENHDRVNSTCSVKLEITDNIIRDACATRIGAGVFFEIRPDGNEGIDYNTEERGDQAIFLAMTKPSSQALQQSKATKVDNRIIGTWIERNTLNLDGSVNKQNDNSSKNYKAIYTKDGRFIPDSRIFRDAAKKGGVEFQYTDIPTYYFSTMDDRILTLKVPSINASEQLTYEIKGDSLILNDRNVNRIFVRERR
jgi:hypothetical protein